MHPSARGMRPPWRGWRRCADALSLGPGSRILAGPASMARFALRSSERMASAGALAALDALLASRFAETAADRIVSSALARHVTDEVLAGSLVDAIGDNVSRHEVIERIALPIAESGELDKLADRVLDSPAAEQLVARVIDSRLLDQAIERLLESEELWVLVDEVARSPSVTEAIGQQGLGMADQFAEVVRTRSTRADDRVEHAVRGLFKRNGRNRSTDAGGATP